MDQPAQPVIPTLPEIATETAPDIMARLGISLTEPLTNIPTNLAGPLFIGPAPVPIATGIPVITGARALLQGDCWAPVKLGQEGAVPEYQYKSNGGLIRHNIVAEDPDTHRLDYVVGEAAWGLVNTFDVPTAHLHLAFSAYAARGSRPWDGEIHIKGTDLINVLGLDRRKDLTKAEKLEKITEQALLLSALSVRLNWKLPKGKTIDHLARMWEVSITRYGQERLTDPEGPISHLSEGMIPEEVILTVRPGTWARYFLNREELKEGTSLFHISYLAAQTLKFDPYQEPVASRLALFLTLTGGAQNTHRKVGPLIEFAFSPEKRKAAQTDKDQRYSVKHAFDNALYALHQEGWKFTFPEETYPAYLLPNWVAKPGEGPKPRLPKEYYSKFLKATLVVQPPGNIPQRLAANRGLPPPGTKGPQRPRSRSVKMTGAEIRQARIAQKLSQQQLGEIVGKSRSWVAHVEGETRTPSPEDLQVLHRVLDKSGGERA